MSHQDNGSNSAVCNPTQVDTNSRSKKQGQGIASPRLSAGFFP